jgi:VWFA-related protein
MHFTETDRSREGVREAMNSRVTQRHAHRHALHLLMLLAILATSAAVSRAQDPSAAAGEGNPPTDKTQGNPTETQTPKDNGAAKQEVSVQDTGTTFKLRVNLVQVHVIVRDAAGKPVENLRKEDFQLYDSGKLQAITTFGVETAKSRKERSEAAAKTQTAEGETVAGGSVSLPERFVAMTFDDIHLAMNDAVIVRVAAGRFVDAMSPGDRVGIFSTSGQLAHDFTSDKEALKQKLLGLMPRGQINSSTTECPSLSYYLADKLEKEGLPSTRFDPAPQDFQVVLQETLRCMPGIDPYTTAVNAVRRVLSKRATKKVTQKSGLNRSILDASPRELRRQLEYQTQWQGGLLVPVPAQNTSRKCPECGHVAAENRKTQSQFVCIECGFSAHADFVGAVNIREAGLASLACSSASGDVSPSWQEPTEGVPA